MIDGCGVCDGDGLPEVPGGICTDCFEGTCTVVECDPERFDDDFDAGTGCEVGCEAVVPRFFDDYELEPEEILNATCTECTAAASHP